MKPYKFIIGIFIVIISCSTFVLLKNLVPDYDRGYTEKAAYGYNTDMRNVRWMGSLVRGDVFPDKGIIAKNTIASFTINGKAYINGGQSRDRNFVRETVTTSYFT